jgi:hypothetical protein
MLRRMHTKLDDIQAEMRLRFTGIETGLAAIEQRLAAFRAANATRPKHVLLRRRISYVEP